MSKKLIYENKKALHNYSILEKYEAGLKLLGYEVKSVKKGQLDLKGSYVTIKALPKTGSFEAWLVNAHISAYSKAGHINQTYNPKRDRRLLLNKKELRELFGRIKEKGLTILPLSVYTSGSLIKLEIGLGQGKKKFDKRATIKKKEFDRRKQRLISR